MDCPQTARIQNLATARSGRVSLRKRLNYGKETVKSFAVAMLCAAALSACSGQAANTGPALATIEKATLAYANCIDKSARNLAAQSGETEILARQAVGSCRDLREKALALKGVPVMFPTVSEYDATHLGLARQSIESAREKK